MNSIADTSKVQKSLYTILLLIMVLISVETAKGQVNREEPPPARERIFFGGSFALQLGSITNIEVLPVVGYWVLPRLSVAGGPGFRFYQFEHESTSIFSARTFVQFVFLRDIDKFIPLGIHTSIFAQFEDELMSLDTYYWKQVNDGTSRFWSNSMMGGAGMSQQIGPRSSMNIMVLWSLNNPYYEVYSTPVIRIGFVF